VATEYIPDLNPVDYKVLGITRSVSTAGPYSTSLISQ